MLYIVTEGIIYHLRETWVWVNRSLLRFAHMNAGLSTFSAKPLERNQSVRSVQELWARLRLMCPLEIIASGLQQKRSYLDWNYGFFLGFEKIWDNVGTQLNMIYNKGQLIFRKFNAKLLHIYQLRQHGWWKPTVAGNAIKQF